MAQFILTSIYNFERIVTTTPFEQTGGYNSNSDDKYYEKYKKYKTKYMQLKQD